MVKNDIATSSAAPPANDTTLGFLRSMLLQRRFEEKAAEAYAIGKIGGFCHLYIGQEAISTAAMSVLRPDDYVITAYRDHALALERGMTPREVMAELFGRAAGCAGGKGGSMHMFDSDLNFLGGHGIVGGHLPIATGVGFAIKYRGGDQVCICFFGEAAVNIGAFHEALNMASLWNLPVIYVIENNGYGMGTAVARATAQQNVRERAESYAMIGVSVDGQDVLTVRNAMAEAVERARTEKRPTLLEVCTTRFVGHSMSDAASGTYRSKEELERALQRDPITLLKDRLKSDGALNDEEFTRMDEDARAAAQDAWDFADAAPEPAPEELFTHVLSDAIGSEATSYGMTSKVEEQPAEAAR
ncbi:MAG: pyruvate dehydrogenase (acetyl-transferring) E1 component subunit alpha [Gemmatimonadaceae bacterium]